VAFCALPVSSSISIRLAGMKQKVTTCVVYICAAISSVSLLLCLLKSFPSIYRSIQFTLIASASALLLASLIVFQWPRVSHWLGLISGIVALHWFYGVELGYFPALNTWVSFNIPDAMHDSYRDILIAKLKIAFAIAMLAAATISATRLLPSHWMMRRRPVRDRLWPALAISLIATFFWYAISVSPYRIPWIVDAVPAKLALLHVEKNGSQFHETGISVFEDGEVYLSHNDRRFFQYRFPVHMGSAVLSHDNTMREAAFALAEQLANANTAPAVPLHSRDAEGWYVRTEHRHVLAFTTENRTAPPPKLLGLFRSLESAVPATKRSGDMKDICFGFCYDPLAGLGIVYMNDRCTDRNGTHCR
jgi:hypothetical protein